MSEDVYTWQENNADWGLPDFIHYLCSRPKMFFRGESFEPCAMYITGFAFGRGGEAGAQLDRFTRWLAHRFYESQGAARNYFWAEYIERYTPAEVSKYAELKRLFDQFQEDERQDGAIGSQHNDELE